MDHRDAAVGLIIYSNEGAILIAWVSPLGLERHDVATSDHVSPSVHGG
jgi:hypothetical protein